MATKFRSNSPRYVAQRRASGFSLIELMIAVALGLLVIGSVLAMFVSISQSNARNLQSTRLTQELRAVSEVIARDLRRARYIDGAIAQIGRGDFATSSFNDITTSANCIEYSYQNAPLGNFRSISRRLSGTDGRIVLAAADDASDCEGDGLVLSSSEVDITSLSFAQPAANLVEISVSGKLRGVNDSVARTFVQTVRVRSSRI